jgi:hypothetical protein
MTQQIELVLVAHSQDECLVMRWLSFGNEDFDVAIDKTLLVPLASVIPSFFLPLDNRSQRSLRMNLDNSAENPMFLQSKTMEIY